MYEKPPDNSVQQINNLQDKEVPVIDTNAEAVIFSKIKHDQNLSLFQKILLTTDGTVTNLLQLATKESIKVKKIEQEIYLSGENETYLCPVNTPVLRRNIILCSETKNYLYAESLFIFENLSRSTQYKLLETDLPIGLLWKKEKLESLRQIIDFKVEECGFLAPYFDLDPTSPIYSRSYLISNKLKPLGIITEKFPASFFKE